MTNQLRVAGILVVVASVLGIRACIVGKSELAAPEMPPISLKCVHCDHAWSLSQKQWHAYFDRIRAKNTGGIPIADMQPPCPSCGKPQAGVVQRGEEPVDPGFDPVDGGTP